LSDKFFCKVAFCLRGLVGGRPRAAEKSGLRHFSIYETGLPTTDNKLTKEHGTHQYWLVVDRSFLHGTVDNSSHAASSCRPFASKD